MFSQTCLATVLKKHKILPHAGIDRRFGENSLIGHVQDVFSESNLLITKNMSAATRSEVTCVYNRMHVPRCLDPQEKQHASNNVC